MQGVFYDCRYALRQLRKTPGFTLVAVLSLALGIGASTAVFSIVYAAIINPYPFRDWQRMTWLAYLDQTGNPQCCLNLTGTQAQRLREARSIEEIVPYQQQDLVMTGGDLPEDINTIYWTPNAINYFGVPPALGRGFIPSDAPAGQDPQPVAMLGYRFWQRHFGGDPGVLGKTIELSHNSYRIIGVMSSKISWGGADVFLPLKLTPDPNTRLLTTIRLKPGATVDGANAELQPMLEEFARETPVYFPFGFHVHLRTLFFGISTGLGPSLYLLLGAVTVLLLIACLNVAMLLFARGNRRQYELAVRAAIGAPQGRIVRQLLTESLVLAFLGEVLGIVLAYVLQRILIWELPGFLGVREPLIYINIPVLLFSVGLALVAVLVFGLVPAVQSSRRHISQTMQLQAQKITGGGLRRSGNLLIAGQIALSLVLLVAASTAITAFLRLMHSNLGYDPKNAMALNIPLRQNSYTTWQARSAYFDRLRERIASTPDVTTAAISTETIPPSRGWNTALEIFGRNTLNQEVNAGFVSQEYFEALRIPLLRGRLWSKTEIMSAAHLAIVNQTLVRQYWPDGNAIGKQIRLPKLIPSPSKELGAPASDGWAEIIGVVGDALNDGLTKPVKAAAYFPYTFHMPMATKIMVRTRSNPLALLRLFRVQVQAVDADQQFAGEDTQTLEDFIARENDWQAEHLVALLFSAFALITVLLAAVGLYSVVSYTVVQRTSEFALRMALGARRADVLLSVLLSTIRIVLMGLAAGAALSLLLKSVVAQWAYAPPSSPLIFFLMTPLLIAVATLAAFFPALRAMSVDPIKVLRHE
ncbi:MAG TPA: ABC transporter permease [Alphaproteobacteria bacterium]|nr:ABC transporter permease [Alphaproteobacteria bacterium]